MRQPRHLQQQQGWLSQTLPLLQHHSLRDGSSSSSSALQLPLFDHSIAGATSSWMRTALWAAVLHMVIQPSRQPTAAGLHMATRLRLPRVSCLHSARTAVMTAAARQVVPAVVEVRLCGALCCSRTPTPCVSSSSSSSSYAVAVPASTSRQPRHAPPAGAPASTSGCQCIPTHAGVEQQRMLCKRTGLLAVCAIGRRLVTGR